MTARSVARAALMSGSLASLTSTIALMAAARVEGKGALQPVNATSHWLHGERAAAVERLDAEHTGVGYATHHAATVFWALLFETLQATRGRRTPRRLVGDALSVSAIAAAIDYGATPRRFTPGWEFVLSKRSMAAAYAAMGAGFLLAAMARRRR